MTHDGITNTSSGKHSKRRTDWDRVDRMSDEDIRVAAARDPDAQLDDQVFWAQAEDRRRKNVMHGERERYRPGVRSVSWLGSTSASNPN